MHHFDDWMRNERLWNLSNSKFPWHYCHECKQLNCGFISTIDWNPFILHASRRWLSIFFQWLNTNIRSKNETKIECWNLNSYILMSKFCPLVKSRKEVKNLLFMNGSADNFTKSLCKTKLTRCFTVNFTWKKKRCIYIYI